MQGKGDIEDVANVSHDRLNWLLSGMLLDATTWLKQPLVVASAANTHVIIDLILDSVEIMRVFC
jgi:hypothetical protein